jgi:hypothetical protein
VHLSQEARAHDEFDDVAITVLQSSPCAEDGKWFMYRDSNGKMIISVEGNSDAGNAMGEAGRCRLAL